MDPRLLHFIEDLIFEDNSIHVMYKKIVSETSQKVSTSNLLVCSNFRENHTRPDAYCEDWLPQYVETDFFRLFRLSKKVFANLLGVVINDDLIKMYHGGNEPVSPEKSLLITLWYLGKGETLRSIGDKFNLSDSTVLNITEKYIERLASLANKYIVWPTNKESEAIAVKFEAIKGYPGVIGAIDGSHIPCKVPEQHQASYCNRKQTHSIVLQGICTADKIFTNIFVGYPGSAHDSRVFQNSKLYKNLDEIGVYSYFYDKKYHLLGDSAYSLREWLITPFIDYGRLTKMERDHNYYHSCTRVVIENTFALLKGRWRILHYVKVQSIKKVVLITTACCVLHNFAYLLNDTFPETYTDKLDDADGAAYSDRTNISVEGVTKRNNIKNLLC